MEAGIQQLLALGSGQLEQAVGDLLDPDRLPLLAVEIEGLHAQKIHDSLELGFEPDRDLKGHGVVPQPVAQLVDHARRVGAGAVAFVYKRDAGDLVAAHLLVHGDRLGLDPADCAQHQDRAVEHPQRAFHLDGEIDVARRVDDVDLVVLPLAEGRGRSNGDAPLAFQIHAVHEGPHAVLALDVVHGVDPLRVKEDALGEGGFARVDVGADPDVSDFLDILFHRRLPLEISFERRCGLGKKIPPRSSRNGDTGPA